MNQTLKDLVFSFDTAFRFNHKYVAVLIEMEGFEKPELIINSHKNIMKKIEYYKTAYNEDLTLKNNPTIRIIAFAYGDNIRELFHDLLIDMQEF